ncbi:potassium/proton antiporter [Altericroceibacterium endophyticum]|uniref:Potassium/proton antiporter n=1 Tax=Altericroceibacterium endophyticum TaxID=1808508 RepID=A0A6I4T4E4_9SPHN|nr:potassium/proton antiporter [Altericroceibacterium endophyticum]
MHYYSIEIVFLASGVLLALTVFAGTISSRFGLPSILGFLFLGMLAGSDGPGGIAFDDYSLAQGVSVACLIFILFSGGLDTKWRKVRGQAPAAMALATVGVMISAGIMTVTSMVILDFTPLQGFLLGSVIASTDAAAVFAVLRSLNIPLRPKVQNVIELESGSNDPMAVFLVGAALMLIANPGDSPRMLLPEFGVQMVVGALSGLIIGFVLPALLKRIPLQVRGLALVVSVAAALTSYGLAGVLGGNGFLAAYIAGIVAATREYPAKPTVTIFQEGIAWLAQVAMFLTLGLLVFPSQLPEVILSGFGLTLVLMLIARPVSVFIALAPFRALGWREKLFISWAGLRGAVPIVLATFPIVAGVPSAQTIFNVVFFVVLVSSAVQGPTLKWLARKTAVLELDDQTKPS